MRRLLYGLGLLLIAALGMAAWHRAAPRLTPPGQPPLTTLAKGDLGAIRDRFNAPPEETRLLVMLSPT